MPTTTRVDLSRDPLRLWVCSECGAMCPKENQPGHEQWHRWLSDQLADARSL